MHSKLFRAALLAVLSILMTLAGLWAAAQPSAAQQGRQAEDQKYAGTWTGTYSTEGGGTDKVSYTLSKDEKGQWRGTIKFANQDGEQTGELRAVQIADGKFKAKLDSPDGKVEVTIEGTFQGDKFEGAYSVSPKDSTDVVEKGTWKVTRSAAPKTGQ